MSELREEMRYQRFSLMMLWASIAVLLGMFLYHAYPTAIGKSLTGWTWAAILLNFVMPFIFSFMRFLKRAIWTLFKLQQAIVY